MSAGGSASSDDDSFAAHNRIDQACDRFEAAWRVGERPRIEDWLASGKAASERAALLRELLMVELCWRERNGERPDRHEYLGRFGAPADVAGIMEVFGEGATATVGAAPANAVSPADPTKIGR
ncbi:MAG: hypothetical protein ACLQIB_34775 [Isosphaeraceae bacterium]